MFSISQFVALVLLGWYIFIVVVCTIGYVQLFRCYRSRPAQSVASQLGTHAPHVTVIRPCKGEEPYLYECLAATFLQDYPIDKISIDLCISSRDDPAYDRLKRVLEDYPQHHARILVEEEDPALSEQGQHDGDDHNQQRKSLGPNPKIRNMSRAYREAKGDILWIIDCNIWVNRGTCGRLVDKLCGFTAQGLTNPYKFVHQLPIAVDVDTEVNALSRCEKDRKRTRPASGSYDDSSSVPLLDHTISFATKEDSSTPCRGGRLEELFLSSSHAKMYVSISTMAVAPCIVGKSNMFRRSHLDFLTSSLNEEDNEQRSLSSTASSTTPSSQQRQPPHTGIDYFSHNICEDHLIGDLLWKARTLSASTSFPSKLCSSSTSEITKNSKPLGNHGLVFGDLAIQPIASMPVSSYIARRVRWLRVRKFTVPTATFVETGTESVLCSAYGAWSVTTLRFTSPFFGSSWSAFVLLWLLSMTVWCAVDWTVYLLLHSGATIEMDAQQREATIPNNNGEKEEREKQTKEELSRIPPFVQPPRLQNRYSRRPFHEWFFAWFGREALALPIWTWAVCGGVTVTWRERKFWVGMDMKVHEYEDSKNEQARINGSVRSEKSRKSK